MLRRALEAHEAEHAALTALLAPTARAAASTRRAARAARPPRGAPETPPPEAAAGAHRERALRLAEAGDVAARARRCPRRRRPRRPSPTTRWSSARRSPSGPAARPRPRRRSSLRARRLVDAEIPTRARGSPRPASPSIAAGRSEHGRGRAPRRALPRDRPRAGGSLPRGAGRRRTRARRRRRRDRGAPPRLVPLLPTGKRPAALLRLASLLTRPAGWRRPATRPGRARPLAARSRAAVETLPRARRRGRRSRGGRRAARGAGGAGAPARAGS